MRIQFYAFFLFIYFFCGLNLKAKTDKYRLIIRDNPATSMCIGWNQISGFNPVVYYDTIDHGNNVTSYTKSIKPIRQVSFREMTNTFARLENLKPQTKYYFIIKDDNSTSQRFWFETLPNDSKTPLSIIFGGDSRRSRRGNDSHEPRVNTNKMVAKVKPHFVAFGGDFTLNDGDKQWATWFDDWQYSIDQTGKITPLVPTRGNHERSNEVIVNLFDIEEKTVVYALNFGGNLLRLYTLNSLDPIVESNQTNWLKNDLETHKNKEIWRIAQYHYPIMPHQSTKHIQVDQFNHWAPLFFKYKFRVVVESDAHVVKTTWPIKPSVDGDDGFIRDTNGTTYVGEGSWGLTRPNDVSYAWTRATASFTQFKWVILSEKEMIVRTVITTNIEDAKEVALDDRYKTPSGFKLWKIDNLNELVVQP
ncbi:MAG: fibronectin type III domain-containing protein [Salibacteraceae bacterium]